MSVVVQADLTVTAAPDLCPDVLVGLDAIADLENASGALTYRLDATRITRAVQAGRSPSDIVDFPADASAVPLPDAAVRLIHDAAAKAGSVRVIAAPTVVVTEVPLAKVRAALERKGLTPEAVVGGAGRPVRSSAGEAAFAAQRAAELRAAVRAACSKTTPGSSMSVPSCSATCRPDSTSPVPSPSRRRCSTGSGPRRDRSRQPTDRAERLDDAARGGVAASG